MNEHERNIRQLAKTIRSARDKRGVSSYALADQVNVSRSSIARIEHAEFSRPSPEFLQRLAHALDLDLRHLLHLAGHVMPEDLPDLEIYLREKHQLPEPAIQQLKHYLAKLKAQYDPAMSGPAPGEDEAADVSHPQAA